MFTLHKLFEIYGLNPAHIRLLRHSNAEIPILSTFHTNPGKFQEYQSFQLPERFRNATYIAAFAPGRGTQAIFLGLWAIDGHVGFSDFTPTILSKIEEYGFPESWLHDHVCWYDLRMDNEINELSERLIIEWGKATVDWVQSKDKEIVEIRSKAKVADFISYDDVNISYADLKKVIHNPDSNFTWYSALSAVNGIYLIQDTNSGKLYIGSAYGENGFWARWSTYIKTGHGGNVELKPLNPEHFTFSILEIVSSTVSFDTVIERENKWKEKLGTRKFGLNNN